MALFQNQQEKQLCYKKLLFDQDNSEHNNSIVLETNCTYCQMKQRNNINEKCIIHMEEDTADGQDEWIEDLSSDIQANLEDAQEGLQQYWEKIGELCKKFPQKIKEDVRGFLSIMRNIEDLLYKFIPENQNKTERRTTQQSNKEWDSSRKISTKSEKFVPAENKNNFLQDYTDINSIQQWVQYFHRILLSGNLEEDADSSILILPGLEHLEMKIFKETMEKKFLKIGSDLQKCETKLKENMQKLLFYIDHRDVSKVPQSTTYQDLKALEQDEAEISALQIGTMEQKSQVMQMLLMQATCLEACLDTIGSPEPVQETADRTESEYSIEI